MDFLISGTHISPVYLVCVGFVIGVMGGFFGVGGSFLAGPALRLAGLSWNMTIGTDLAHIVGKSIVAVKQHRALGNVDLKLGAIMTIGTIAGVEAGAQAIEALTKAGLVNSVVSYVSISVYVAITLFMGFEGWKTARLRKKSKGDSKDDEADKKGKDVTAFSHITRKIQRFRFGPMISLPSSGIAEISLILIISVSFVGGFFSGFLGGGGGYIRMPAMVYLLGIPTHLAVGTDLFEIMISASYGTFSHALKGNVDILVALVMHTGAAVGAQIGATCTQYFQGAKIRLAFVPLPLIGALIIIYTLISNHKL